MPEPKTEKATIDSIFRLVEERRFGWVEGSGDGALYHLVQNPEQWHHGCFAAVTGPNGETSLRVSVHIIPKDTEITFKV